MNASSMEKATEVDYFITNVVEADTVTASWIVRTYTEGNWVEVFHREAKGWLGLREYQVRDKRSLLRHFILVFCAYTFILWHQLTGGLQRRWANRPLNTFVEALEALRMLKIAARVSRVSYPRDSTYSILPHARSSSP